MKGKVTLTIVLGLVCFVLAAVMFAQFKTIENTDITSIEAMRESELRTTLANWKTKYEEANQQLIDTQNKIAEYEEKIEDFLNFVFDDILDNIKYNELPENTSLQKALKKKLLNKEGLHLGLGILKKE